MNKLSSLLLSLSLLVLPALFLFQIKEGQTWAERLILPQLEQAPNRHTPLFTEGLYLPSRITKNLVLTKNQSPIILAGTTTIDSQARLTIEPGTILYANEFASLIVEGEVVIQDGVILTTNEVHPANKVWNGLIVQPSGKATLQNSTIDYAYPGISCMKGSSGILSNVHITNTSVDIFNEDQACAVK